MHLLCCQDKRELRAMLSLGNFYFARALLAKGGSDATGAAQFLKDSYKFFHHVLAQDMTNAYGKYAYVCVLTPRQVSQSGILYMLISCERFGHGLRGEVGNRYREGNICKGWLGLGLGLG